MRRVALAAGAIACLTFPLSAQNPRGIITSHPRTTINSTIADTWTPASSRLAAIIARTSGGGQAQSDFNTLRTIYEASALGNCTRDGGGHTTSCAAAYLNQCGDNCGYLMYMIPAFFYQVFTARGDTVTANTFADLLIDKGLLDSTVWWMPGGAGFSLGSDSQVMEAEGAAEAADWIWNRIEARGGTVKTDVIAALKRMFQTYLRDDSFSTSVRESDYHNYSLPWWSAWLRIGLTLYGEDSSADALIDKAWGILSEGYTYTPSAQSPTDSYLFKVKDSVSLLTGGAMNWEGPQYWRSAVPELLRAIEAYDTATGRAHNVWANDFPTAYRAGLYKIYIQQPDGKFPGIGDAATGNNTAGRDNFGMAILTDRFSARPEAGYFKAFMDSLADPWDAGSGGSIGLFFKLIYYPYTGLSATPYTSLPLADKFGNDTVVRTGWTSTDSFFVMQAGYSGAYHRSMEQGAFHLFAGGSPILLKGGPYAASVGYYYNNYFRQTVAANGGLLIYNSADCVRDTSINCTLANVGGQRWPWRRHNPPYSAFEYQINHLWSAEALTGNYSANYPEQYAVAPSTLQTGTGFAYIKADLTKAYANVFSIDPDNPTAYSPNHNTGKNVSLVTRDTVVFTGTGDVVMFDRVNATRSTYTKKLVLHSIGAPVVGTTQTAAGDNTYTNQTVIKADKSSGRVYAKILLPITPSIRVVGGNACPTITISGMTSANPAVITTATPHGIVTGETVGFTVAFSPSTDWLNISSNSGSDEPPYLTADVINSTSYKLKRTSGAYVNSTGYVSPSNPLQVWHDKCAYEGLVDDFPDPADATGATRISKNAWVPEATYRASFNAFAAMYRMEIAPASAALNDNFLVIYRPTTTSNSVVPIGTLISSTEFYGALVDNSAVAMFGKLKAPLTRGSYTVAHSGAASHVVSGLVPGMLYTVTQDGILLGPFAAGTSGAIGFSETGGGTFAVGGQPSSTISGNAATGGAVVIH